MPQHLTRLRQTPEQARPYIQRPPPPPNPLLRNESPHPRVFRRFGEETNAAEAKRSFAPTLLAHRNLVPKHTRKAHRLCFNQSIAPLGRRVTMRQLWPVQSVWISIHCRQPTSANFALNASSRRLARSKK